MKMVTMPESEYNRLIALEKVDWEFVADLDETLKEFKSGKAIKC